MKHKRQIGILLALALIAALVWLANFRDKPVVADTPSLKDDPVIGVENPRPRLENIDRARKTEYKSLGRNPFSPVQAPPLRGSRPAPPREIVGPKDQPAPPPPPPLTLPPNVKFYGFGTVPNGTSRRAFFTDGDEVYVLGEGDILLKRFRILRIGNASLEFEEISSGRVGTTPLEEQAGGPPQ